MAVIRLIALAVCFALRSQPKLSAWMRVCREPLYALIGWVLPGLAVSCRTSVVSCVWHKYCLPLLPWRTTLRYTTADWTSLGHKVTQLLFAYLQEILEKISNSFCSGVE